VSEGYGDKYLEGSMRGWYTPCTFGTPAIMAHWVTFLFLFVCTMYLARDSWTARGPGGRERWYAGYHEDYNISLYVNLFAMIAYFGKIVADSVGHNYNNVGPLVIGLGNYRYADYMLTCPLLAYDLMSQVRAPFKITGGVLIFCVLLTGTATNYYPGDEMRAGSMAWFIFGCFLYFVAYYLFYTVVKIQYTRLLALAASTEAKKAFMPLKLALYTFFSIWIVFPIVWLLGHQGLNILSNDAQECLHCACDLTAKSFYGFALAKYRKYFDKKMFDMLTELGIDGEEGLEHLEQDLKNQDIGDGKADIKRMSTTRGPGLSVISVNKHHPAFLAVPPATDKAGFLRHPSFQPSETGRNWPNMNVNSASTSPRDNDRDGRDGRDMCARVNADGRDRNEEDRDRRDRRDDDDKQSVDDLKSQLATINLKLQEQYDRKRDRAA